MEKKHYKNLKRLVNINKTITDRGLRLSLYLNNLEKIICIIIKSIIK